MPRPRTANDSSIAIRVPEAWLDRAEGLRDWLAARLGPGGEVTRSDVIRAALARGLDALEAERAASGKRGRGK